MASDLEAELELLRSALEQKGLELRDVIREETQRKEAELQVALLCACVCVGGLTWLVWFFAVCVTAFSEAALGGNLCSALV